jgi:hypothetical protein
MLKATRVTPQLSTRAPPDPGQGHEGPLEGRVVDDHVSLNHDCCGVNTSRTCCTYKTSQASPANIAFPLCNPAQPRVAPPRRRGHPMNCPCGPLSGTSLGVVPRAACGLPLCGPAMARVLPSSCFGGSLKGAQTMQGSGDHLRRASRLFAASSMAHGSPREAEIRPWRNPVP